MQEKIFLDIDLTKNQEDLFTLSEKYTNLSQPVENYQLSFSKTKTNHLFLTSMFQQQYKEISTQIQSQQQGENNLMKIYLSSQAFIARLESSKLYNDVDLFLLPGEFKDQVHLHFSIKDRSPFFLSLQNSFGQDGSATVQLKTGMKNFFGFQDTLSFDFERQLSGNQILNWALAWGFTRKLGDRVSFSLSQAERGVHNALWERKRGLLIKYISNRTEYFIEKSIQANKISLQNSSIRDVVKSQYHLNHLDFLPDSTIKLGVEHKVYTSLQESERENILEGSTLKIRSELGLPYLSSTFFKCSLTHQFQHPLYKYKKWLYNFKNASFQSNLNIGVAASKDLKFHDTYNLNTCRGYQEIIDQTELSQAIDPKIRQINCFYKADFKLNFHNVGALRTQHAKMFYYLSGFGMIEKDSNKNFQICSVFSNTRVVGGIGLSMPVAETANIELLLNMFGLNKKRFDKFTTLQIRVAIED